MTPFGQDVYKSSNTPEGLIWIAPGVAIVPWWPKFELSGNVWLRVLYTPIAGSKRACWAVHDGDTHDIREVGTKEMPALDRAIAASLLATGKPTANTDPAKLLRKCREECAPWGY